MTIPNLCPHFGELPPRPATPIPEEFKQFLKELYAAAQENGGTRALITSLTTASTMSSSATTRHLHSIQSYSVKDLAVIAAGACIGLNQLTSMLSNKHIEGVGIALHQLASILSKKHTAYLACIALSLIGAYVLHKLLMAMAPKANSVTIKDSINPDIDIRNRALTFEQPAGLAGVMHRLASFHLLYQLVLALRHTIAHYEPPKLKGNVTASRQPTIKSQFMQFITDKGIEILKNQTCTDVIEKNLQSIAEELADKKQVRIDLAIKKMMKELITHLFGHNGNLEELRLTKPHVYNDIFNGFAKLFDNSIEIGKITNLASRPHFAKLIGLPISQLLPTMYSFMCGLIKPEQSHDLMTYLFHRVEGEKASSLSFRLNFMFEALLSVVPGCTNNFQSTLLSGSARIAENISIIHKIIKHLPSSTIAEFYTASINNTRFNNLPNLNEKVSYTVSFGIFAYTLLATNQVTGEICKALAPNTSIPLGVTSLNRQSEPNFSLVVPLTQDTKFGQGSAHICAAKDLVEDFAPRVGQMLKDEISKSSIANEPIDVQIWSVPISGTNPHCEFHDVQGVLSLVQTKPSPNPQTT